MNELIMGYIPASAFTNSVIILIAILIAHSACSFHVHMPWTEQGGESYVTAPRLKDKKCTRAFEKIQLMTHVVLF